MLCTKTFGRNTFQTLNTNAKTKATVVGRNASPAMVKAKNAARKNQAFQIQVRLYFINKSRTPVQTRIAMMMGINEVFSSTGGRSPIGKSLNSIFPVSALFTVSIY